MTVKMKDGSNDDDKSDKEGKKNIWPLLGLYTRRNNPRLHQQRLFSRSRPFLQDVAPLRDSVDTYHDPESFHCAMGRILVLAQCFGLLPIYGVLSPSPRKLVFRRSSPRTIYALVILISMLIIAVASVLHMLKTLDTSTFGETGGIGAATSGAIFYGNSVLGSAIFMWLSPRWVLLQREWRAMERLVDRCGRPRLRRKFSLITAMVLLLALFEHIMSIIKNTPEYIWRPSNNATVNDFFQEYSLNSHAFVLSSWNYNMALGIFLFVISKMATFTWNFTDLFVMLVATGLAERYKTLNSRVTATDHTTPNLVEWRTLRQYYAALSALVKRVDSDVSPIILLSFANNLYFICLQLLNGISRPEKDGMLNSVYFFGSFGFLLCRTAAVTLLAARINDQSKVVLPLLYTCPASMYCLETQRLQYQLANDEIALTGLKFFSITRNFMLAVAGAIVTYEVVLLQFNVAIMKN